MKSYSYREVGIKLGYISFSDDVYDILRNRIYRLNINIEHFSKKSRISIKRTPENLFIENSTASQQTLRLHYKKGNYTPYVCSICGQLPIWQGKDLTLILDHINGKNHDDRLENLRWVCPNCNQQLDTTTGKNRQTKINKKYYCIDCGKEISEKSTRCKSCSAKKFNKQDKRFEVTREELKDLIRTIPFVIIGKQFGVSDNAIRKRCKALNLPSKPTEIKKYTDEEWKKV